MITHYPIKWWVERFKKPISLARFGDGEWLCIEGKSGGNSHGCAYTPELRVDLLSCLTDNGIVKGMQRILPSQYRRIRPHTAFGQWVDTEVFADELAEGNLKPLFDLFREATIVIISSKEKRVVPLPYAHFIEVPRTNAHAEKDRVVKEVLEYGKPALYLFSCGMAAGPFVHALHGKIPGASFIDIGHIFDPFCGEASRDYLRNIDPVKIAANI